MFSSRCSSTWLPVWLLVSTACCGGRHIQTPSAIWAGLASPEAAVRSAAAEAILAARKTNPPLAYLQPLLAAARMQAKPEELKPILYALGSTGAKEAAFPLRAFLRSEDEELQEIAREARKRWIYCNLLRLAEQSSAGATPSSQEIAPQEREQSADTPPPEQVPSPSEAPGDSAKPKSP